jgi:hypothetical protein
MLLIDFTNYFGNIDHDRMLEIYRRAFGEDRRLFWLAELFVKAFGDKGLGLGSETSQVSAVAFTNKIDHYIKEVLKLIFSHYMDDNLFLFLMLRSAHHTFNVVSTMYAEHGIVTKPEKVNIVKLSQGFIFLKAHFSLTETGRIVIRPGRRGITRQRQKLKKFKKLHTAGQMTLEQIRSGYMSWRGYIAHFNSRKTVINMDNLYRSLFGVHPLQKI